MGSIPTQVLRFFSKKKKISGLAYKCYSNDFINLLHNIQINFIKKCGTLSNYILHVIEWVDDLYNFSINLHRDFLVVTSIISL